jgi:hypothetical protein
MTQPDTRGIGLCLVGPMMTIWVGSQHGMTIWVGSQHGPDADPIIFEPTPGPQTAHLEEWASWRRAKGKR